MESDNTTANALDRYIEIQSSRITPKRFWEECRAACESKGVRMPEEIETYDLWKRNRKYSFDCEEGFTRMAPYFYHNHGVNEYGAWNEIMEFDFDTQRLGHGYFFLLMDGEVA